MILIKRVSDPSGLKCFCSLCGWTKTYRIPRFSLADVKNYITIHHGTIHRGQPRLRIQAAPSTVRGIFEDDLKKEWRER